MAVLLSTVALAQTPAPRRPPVDQVLDSFTRVVEFRDVELSPDGARIAWVESIREKDGPAADKRAIYVAPRGAMGQPARVTACPGTDCEEQDPVWSPDGRQLAFLSDAEKRHQRQLYVVEPGAGTPRKLTGLDGTLTSIRWAPDGKSLAFLFIEHERDTQGALGPAPRGTGVAHEVINESRITVMDAAGGEPRQVSPPELFIYEYDWAPDGKAFAATGAPGEGEANWWVAQLFTIPLVTGEAKSLLKPPFQLCVPRFSPDGKAIAFIGGLMSDRGYNGGDVFLIPTSGGPAKNLTPGMKASASNLTWTSNDQILFGEYVDGRSGLATVGRGGGKVTALWTGDESITDGLTAFASFAKDGKTSAAIIQTFSKPPEVYAGTLGAWTPVTHANDGILPAWGEAKSVHWTSDGATVQGWLLPPANPEPGKRLPMVVWVHGGPSGIVRPAFGRMFGALASQGYYLFLPNARGSFGSGEAFTRGNVKDFGHGDLRDILRGVDAVVRSEPVDSDRVGIAGWSYGGYMTMWAVTQTQRFRAAMAGAGISNWQSYYGQNRISTWMLPFFGASVYDAPELYARSSPIQFIKKAKTPTLVLQGERDSEVPAPQSQEFYQALKTLGVDTQMVIYEDEGHAFRKPENRRDMIRRTLAWFEKYLAPPDARLVAPR